MKLPILFFILLFSLISCGQNMIERKLMGVWVISKIEYSDSTNDKYKLWDNIIGITNKNELTLPKTTPGQSGSGNWFINKAGEDYYILFDVDNGYFQGNYKIDLSEYERYKQVRLQSNELTMVCKKVWQ